VTSYPREDLNSVRRKDTKRAEARRRREELKQEEKQRQKEELKRLKSLKKKEIWDTLKRVQDLGGVVDDDRVQSLLNNGVLEDAEFDPDKWDEAMQNVFDDTYYDQAADMKKPQFSDDEDRIPFVGGNDGVAALLGDKLKQERLDGYDYDQGEDMPADMIVGNNDDESEDDEFLMDADYLPGGEHYIEEQPPSTQAGENAGMEKQKKINDFLESYYQLDYEDMVRPLSVFYSMLQYDLSVRLATFPPVSNTSPSNPTTLDSIHSISLRQTIRT
jgi:protein KRI1